MPKINVPLRFYWAYNPLVFRSYIQPPVVLDRSDFQNNETFLSALEAYGTALYYQEHRNTFRFAIRRTF